MSLEGRLITIVEDDAIMGESLVQSLSLEGCAVNWCATGAEAVVSLSRQAPDLVVCDIRLPDTNGDTLFRDIQQRGAAPPFLFVTAYGEIDQAVALMRAGASDYVTKPFEMERFLDRVRTLVERRPLFGDPPILGMSPEIGEVEALLRRIARLKSSVLITGETGTGKEVCARLLHRLSPQSAKPFVAVNCAAIPGDLLESEIFGHEAGAFTGATRRHSGYAERAGDGVLFLDEVGSLPLSLQAKLLRLIEGGSFYRLGGEAEVGFRARLVCATNASLEAMTEDGSFREDLFYRINVVRVEVPPLRRRAKDIPWLMDRFFVEFSAAHDRELRGVSSLAEEAALGHDWAGNVRELRNRMERAVALALGDWIMPADLFPERTGSTDKPLSSLAQVRDEAERRQIERALAQSEGQIIQAARTLGVSRTTLWEKMRRLGLSSREPGSES